MISDVFYIILILTAGLLTPNLFTHKLKEKDIRTIRYLFFYHMLIAFAYYLFTRNAGGDAWGYWLAAKRMSSENFIQYLTQERGTLFMYSFNYVFSGLLGMGFLANTMMYALLGFIGLVFFYIVTLEVIPLNFKLFGINIFPTIFFLPNLHFWSSGVGKDTILFLCIAMFTYSLLKPMRRIPLIVIALLLSLAIRPHITLFLFVAFGLAFILDSKASTWQRTVLAILLLGGGLVILPSVLEFANIESASIEAFEEFAENKSGVLSREHTGSAIDISSYPFPLKVLSFLYRPFFFDARNVVGLVASVENLILLLLLFMSFKYKPYAAFKSAPFVVKGLFFFLMIGTLAFSQSLGNIGIMIRMRNMFLPGYLIFFMWVFSYYKQVRLEELKRVLLIRKRINEIEASKKGVNLE